MRALERVGAVLLQQFDDASSTVSWTLWPQNTYLKPTAAAHGCLLPCYPGL